MKMSVENSLNDTDRSKEKYSEKILSHCHFSHQRPDVDWPLRSGDIYRFISYLTVNTSRHQCKTHKGRLFGKQIFDLSEIFQLSLKSSGIWRRRVGW